MILDGKCLAQKIRLDVTQRVEAFLHRTGVRPGLTVIRVGTDEASRLYVDRKSKACLEVGIESKKIELPEEILQERLLAEIDELNEDRKVHGILVQLPLPQHISVEKVVNRIAVEKDVDGFHVINVGRLAAGHAGLFPCTPLGVERLLDEYNVPVEGSRAVIVGRSNIVGKPMAQLLLRRNATVTICHSKTHDCKTVCRCADILVVAMGKAEMVRGDWVKEGAAVIDVGMNRREDGKLVGDVAFEEVAQRARWISPVPGGVGPLTIAMLLENTLKATEQQIGECV